MSNSNNIPITWDNEQDNNLLGSLFPGGLQNSTLQKTSDNNDYLKKNPFGDDSVFSQVSEVVKELEKTVSNDTTINQTLVQNKPNSANGFYYLYDGTLLGNYGTSNEVVVCDEVKTIPKSKTNKIDYDIFYKPVRLTFTNAELNMRAVMGVIQIHEGSYNNYYKWNGGEIFTEDMAKLGHPGRSPIKNKQAAGAYQIQKDSWDDPDTGSKFRKKYNINDFLPISQDKFTVATIKDKVTVKAFDLIIAGQFKKAYEKMANEWRFIPGKKTQSKTITLEQLLEETKIQLAREVNGLSPVKTLKGQLLSDF